MKIPYNYVSTTACSINGIQITIFDNDYFVCEVFIDLQKVFDTVNHEILFVKLDFHGIHGLANSWLKPFLKNKFTWLVYLDTP